MSPGLLGIGTRPQLSLISLSAAHCIAGSYAGSGHSEGPRMYVTMLFLEEDAGLQAAPPPFMSVHRLLQR